MTIKTERAAEREFSVFDVSKGKFMNLDFVFSTGLPGDPTKYFEKKPDKGFTYEECERFIIHQSGEKKLYSIHNIQQPLFLLNFQIEVLINQYQKEQRDIAQRQHEKSVKQIAENEAKNRAKSSFINDVRAWHQKLNSKEVSMQGKGKEVEAQKPKLNYYGLTREDFKGEEVNNILVRYNYL